LSEWAERSCLISVIMPITFFNLPIEQLTLIGFIVFFVLVGLSAQIFRVVFAENQIVQYVTDKKEAVIGRSRGTNAGKVEAEMLGLLVHDMNTPLTNINLFLDLLEIHPSILTDEPELIESMRSNQQALLNTVRNIIDLEMIRSGNDLDIKRETFDLVQSIESVLKAMKLPAAKKRISIDNQVQGFSLFILADRRQIERVILNLISNAVKYTQEDGRVTVSVEKKDRIVINVEDNGLGIPPEELPFVFDRFTRGKDHRKNVEGFGLGLAVTQSLVKAHGGDITVSSQVNRGSKFAVYLPIDPRA